MARISTVKIEDDSERGFRRINERDFDEDQHMLYEEDASDEASVDATDAARELAEEKDVDLSALTGSGEDGRVLLSDVEDANSDE
jgi:pyruvate/2-oxoglutarate dehydrogenase complex dihydrolipoamide acyltransferase (E2) component